MLAAKALRWRGQFQITIDRADPAGLALFWAEALGLHRCEPAPPLEAGHIVMADGDGNEFHLD